MIRTVRAYPASLCGGIDDYIEKVVRMLALGGTLGPDWADDKTPIHHHAHSLQIPAGAA
jgi:hypothetical protein